MVKERKEINVKDPSRPQHRIQVETYSYPQYGNYLRMTGDERPRQYQRTVRHQYDSVLTFQEPTMQTKVWKYRLGSQKKWNPNPPEKQLKTISRSLRQKYKRKAERKAGPGATKKDINKEYKKLLERHKRGAKYLDVGDWNSQVLGINGDWYWRAQWSYYKHEHLYGLMVVKRPSPITNPMEIPFAPKHMIALIEYLLQKGILRP